MEFIAKLANGLDLTDPEDRALFRGRVERQVALTKLSAINEWLDAKHRSRQVAIRALADLYIKPKTARSLRDEFNAYFADLKEDAKRDGYDVNRADEWDRFKTHMATLDD